MKAFRMRRACVCLRVLVVLGAIAVIGGCSPMTLFLETIESSEVRIKDETFQGRWTSEQLREFFDSDWIVEISGGRRGAYTITMNKVAFEPGDLDELTFTGYLVTLGNRTWIDLVQRDALLEKGYRFTELPDTMRRYLLPVHMVGRIDLKGETISVEWLSADWLEEYLEENSSDLEYLEDSILVISERETVQNFLAAHSMDWAANDIPWIFERVAEGTNK
jgi:hypothetical protein